LTILVGQKKGHPVCQYAAGGDFTGTIGAYDMHTSYKVVTTTQ